MTKPQLAGKMGVSRSAVYAWGEEPPKYVVAYLELLVVSLADKQIVFEMRKLIKMLEEK
jgi:hypothetical protein